jgi:hypothetical protein
MLPLRDLRFQGHEGTFSKTKASQEFTMHTPDKQVPCGGALHAKEEEGRGGCSAPGMVQCRGTRRRGTVVGVCLVPEGGVRVVSGETRMECSLRTRIRG